MAKFRLKFTKEGDVKFISHLDLVRLFTRTFKRAGIMLSYSEGFNPHPKMSIPLPLSVGVTSETEIIDIDTEKELKPDDIISAMNRALPIGIKIVACSPVDITSIKSADISYAEYRVSIEGTRLSKDILNSFMSENSIEVMKKTKRGEKITDIKPDIIHLELLASTPYTSIIKMVLCAGSSANLKPDTVISAMTEFIDSFSCTYFDVHRTAIFDKRMRAF